MHIKTVNNVETYRTFIYNYFNFYLVKNYLSLKVYRIERSL